MTDPRRTGSVRQLALSIYAGSAVGLLTGPLIARALGPAPRGELAAIVSYFECLLALVSLGVPEAIGFHAARAPLERPRLVGAARRYSVRLVPAALLVAWVTVAGPLASLPGPARLGTIVLLSLLPFGVWGACFEQLLRAEGALRPLAEVRFLPFLIHGVAVCALWAVSELSLKTLIAVRLVAVIAPAIWARTRTRDVGGPAVPLRPLVEFGAKAQLGRLAALANVRLDQLLMLPILGAEPLGLYAVGVVVAGLPVGVGEALSTRAFGEVGRAAPEKQGATTSALLRRSMILQIVACAGLMSVAPWLMPLLFGHRFDGALLPALILIPGFAAFGWGLVATSAALALGRPDVMMYSHGAGLCVTLLLLPVLLPIYGIAGAAGVSSASYVTFAATAGVLLRRGGIGEMRPGMGDLRSLVLSLRALAPIPGGSRAR